MYARDRKGKERNHQIEEEILLDVSDLGLQVELLDEEELHSAEEPVEFFYLWDSKIETYKLFLTVKNFLRENQTLDPALIQVLCEKRKIDFEEALSDLPIILSSYLDVIIPEPQLPQKDTTDGRSDY